MTPTAKERAVAVLNAATVEWSEGPGDPDVDEVLVAALMADPGLLVDLAIEAGGLTVVAGRGSVMAQREATVTDVTLGTPRGGSVRLTMFTMGTSLAEVAVEVPVTIEDAIKFRPGDKVVLTLLHKEDMNHA
jgi:hypothetical protein